MRLTPRPEPREALRGGFEDSYRRYVSTGVIMEEMLEGLMALAEKRAEAANDADDYAAQMNWCRVADRSTGLLEALREAKCESE